MTWQPSLPTPLPWMEDANCANSDPVLFFAEDSTADGRQRTRLALAICRTCPVAAECLAYALETDSRHGIWGATTSTDRRQMKRRAS